MKFQSIVIIILGILLIITLISFYYIASTPGKERYPKSIPICPDYYYQKGNITSGGPVICQAMPTVLNAFTTAGVTDVNCKTPSFDNSYYTGTNANCNKYKWATSSACKSIPSWEGITYGVQNPCSTK